MKKFTKFALGCAAVCAAVGLGLSAAGLAMGAATAGKDVLSQALDDTLNSENVRWSVSVFRNDEDWDDLDEDWNQSVVPSVEDGSSIFEFDVFEKLKVDLSADELFFKAYDGNGIRVEVDDHEDRVRIKQDGDSLKIKSLTKMKGTTIIVYYPSEVMFEEVDVEVDAGEIYFENDIHVNEMDIQVGAGKMSAEGVITVNEITLDTGAGNVDIDVLDAKDLEAECGVGSINIGLTGSETDYSYKVECGLGSVQVGDNTYSGIAEKATVINGNTPRKMELECGLGDIDVDWME